MGERAINVGCMIDPRRDCPETCLLYDEALGMVLQHASMTGTEPNESLVRLRENLLDDLKAEEFVKERQAMFTRLGKISYCELIRDNL